MASSSSASSASSAPSSSSASSSTAVAPLPDVLDGMAVLCFVGDRAGWWQGHWIVQVPDADRQRRLAFTLLGKVAPEDRPGRKTYHDCCYPLGLPELYDVLVRAPTEQPEEEPEEVVLDDVERSPGDLPSLTSAHLVFQATAVHLDAAAAETVRALFPSVQPTATTVVCMGSMSIDLAGARVARLHALALAADPAAAAAKAAAAAHHHHG